MLFFNFDECLKNTAYRINFSTKLNAKVLTTEHAHDFYEILFPVENSFFHVLNGKRRELYKYDFCLITPKDHHHSELSESGTPNYFTISIRAEHFERAAKIISPGYLSAIGETHYSKINPQIFEQCKRYLFSALFLSPAETEKKQLLLSLVVTKLITEFPVNTVTCNTAKNLVDEATELMQSPENMKLSVKEIAKKLGYSQEHLIRSFKKQKSNTPNRVFTKIKLEYSSELLCSTDYSILKICETVGFYSLHYFNAKFKEAYGLSPSKYRKKHAKLI